MTACTCDRSLWSEGTQTCPEHGADNQAAAEEEARAELYAENAWLRAAEAPTLDDYAFEAWEAERITPAEFERCYGDARYR